jgi:hypothetical protein
MKFVSKAKMVSISTMSLLFCRFFCSGEAFGQNNYSPTAVLSCGALIREPIDKAELQDRSTYQDLDVIPYTRPTSLLEDAFEYFSIVSSFGLPLNKDPERELSIEVPRLGTLRARPDSITSLTTYDLNTRVVAK